MSRQETCQLQRHSHAKRGPFSTQHVGNRREREDSRDFTIQRLHNAAFIRREEKDEGRVVEKMYLSRHIPFPYVRDVIATL